MTERVITALLAVDVQHDFLPGGALGVAGGDEVVGVLEQLAGAVDLVVATRDFHPGRHSSFTEVGGPWPPHCVIGTAGAALHPAIDALAAVIVSKGMDPEVDAYSGFDGGRLQAVLRGAGAGRVVIGGLATDYCVRATALDAMGAGLETVVITDAVRAVDVRPGDGEAALLEMQRAGVQLLACASFLALRTAVR